MKILVTESQIKTIINEISSLDILLDKVLEKGIDSLSPEERIRLRQLSGEKVSMPKPVAEPEPEVDDESTAIKFASMNLIDNFPSGMSFDIDGRHFETYLNDIEYADVDTEYGINENNFINISDGEITIKIVPYVDNTRKFLIISDTGFKSSFTFNGDIPTDDNSSNIVIQFLTRKTIPDIIKKVIEDQKKGRGLNFPERI